LNDMGKAKETTGRLALCTAVVSMLLASTVSVTPVFAQTRYYAGYYYFGAAGAPPAPGGVRANIVTIDQGVSGQNFYCQWVAVVISYWPSLYWLQVGYNKGYDSHPPYSLEWYSEKQDAGGWQLWWTGLHPTAWSTYVYYVSRNPGATAWQMGVGGQFERTYTPNPNTYVDYQALSETTDFAINIGGTHFSSISYKDSTNWYLWDRHVKRADWPYWVNEIAHYEFTAGGGGVMADAA